MKISLTTPYLLKIKPFSPSDSYDFPFVYTSGQQAVRNNLVIETLEGVEVYNQTIESFSLRHPVPTGSLPTGNLRAKIRVGSVNNEWSQFSEWVIFWVLDEPTVTITNIDYANQNRVYNQTVTFSADYSHPNNELLQSYRYVLYDSNKNLIHAYPEQFSDGATPLTQEVTGLQNGELYYIELKTISVNQQEHTTGLILVRPFYVSPRLNSAIRVDNVSDEGAIRISANMIQIIGKLYDSKGNEIARESVEYIDNEKLDLTRTDYGKLVFQEGFGIDGQDFVLKLWCQNIPDDKVFLTLYSNYGRIDLMKYNDRIHAFKYIPNLNKPSHFVSNEFLLNEGQRFMIYMKSQYSRIDLNVTPV